MPPNSTIEMFSFRPFFASDGMNDSKQVLEVTFFHNCVSSSLETKYITPRNIKSCFKDFKGNSLSVLHLNVGESVKNLNH